MKTHRLFRGYKPAEVLSTFVHETRLIESVAPKMADLEPIYDFAA